MANDNSGTALVLRGNQVEPSTMAELKDFASMAAQSRFFGVESAQQALMIAMAGKDLGFSYTQALRAFHVVKGKPTLSADGMVAACLQHGDCEWFRPVRVTDTEAVWATKPRGGEVIEYRFTMEDAQRAGLVNDMYRKHPKRMLSARCKAYLARDVYPHLLMGLVTDDEAVEIAAKPRPAPVQVESRVFVPEPSESPAAGLAERLNAATDARELADVAAEIKRSALGFDEVESLRVLYLERMKALRGDVREPGEEG